MTDTFEKRLGRIANNADFVLAGGRKGIEKESLRVAPDGRLSQKAHPEALGAALTNRYITTDFSEALLEFVTPAFRNTWEALRTICDIHQFTYENLDDELLWVSSMPCQIPADSEIPLARYGRSNVGQMKTIYRRGLGHRYGRHMQTIAGIHFNYSLPESFWAHYAALLGDDRNEDEFRSDHYLGLVRNVRRYGWIILYLFGASPALCKSFVDGDELPMASLNNETWYERYGTSLRMSDLGYNNQTQSRINIRLNDIDEYISDLSSAIRTPEPAYEKIGVKVDGEYRQLNANQLQIENEYYSSVRPKRVAHSGERPTAALRRGGVEYIEIRSLDLNIFDPCGINQNTMRFVEAFLIYCLLEESAAFDDRARAEARDNQLETARRGREPGLKLQAAGKQLGLAEWANTLLDGVAAVAELIDAGEEDGSYVAAVDSARELVRDPDATPSARVLQEIRAEDCSFFEFALAAANNHREYFGAIAGLTDARRDELRDEASESLQRQRDIEAADKISLDDYLGRYFMSRKR